MSNNLNLSQQSKLQQRLNPKQVMLGRFLEMSAPEIEDEVRRALDENPALEVVDEQRVDANDDVEPFAETAEQLRQADYNDDDIPSYRLEADNYASSNGRPDFQPVNDQTSLYDVLLSQLSEVEMTDSQRQIAEYIIGNLDDSGYMTRSLIDIADDISIAEGIDVSLSDVKAVYAMIRNLDPAGIAAVDLRDCLLIQIDRASNTMTSKIAHEIIADWFDLFSKKHFDQLRSHLGVSQDQFAEAINYIRRLNPKPGALIEGNTTEDRMRHIVPDFFVDVDDSGRVTVSLNNTNPELAIESSFDIDDDFRPATRRHAEARLFLKRRRDEAAMFIEMLKMRAQTLLTVMRAIVKIQHKFFITGDRRDIKSMIIRDVADMTGLNISVISRAASSKYVLTSRGMFPLKMFFNESPTDANDASSHRILSMLAEIIADEDKKHPLSDDAICRALSAKGIDIARRTVTKYRERLGLPVARLRKQF